MPAGAIYPGYSASLLSIGNQSSAQDATPSNLRNRPPQDVVSISNAARQAHSAALLFDSAPFFSIAANGPAATDPAPFQRAVAAIQYQQVQSFLETGTTSYRPGSVANVTG